MTGVFYFPRYAHRENFATNNTLLLMHRLYDDNRRRFQRFLAHLLEEKADTPLGEIGLRISQQIGTPGSVLDGFLHQPAIRIAIETKRAGIEFDLQQLIRHLDAFDVGSSGYLILLRPNAVDLSLPQWRELRKKAERKNVILASVTFEKVIASFRHCLMDHDETMLELIDDFESFCSEQQLLDTDKVTIFAPPCGKSFAINAECRLYFCPAEWSRRRVRFLGIYKNKSVQLMGEINHIIRAELRSKKILVCENEAGSIVSIPPDQQRRIRRAIEMASLNGWDISHGHKFFLCDQLYETDFRKTSPGGIMGHRYLSLENYFRPQMSMDELAQALKIRTWE